MEDEIKKPAPVDADETATAPIDEETGEETPEIEEGAEAEEENEAAEIKPVKPPMADDVPGEGAPMGGEEKIAA